ncbi:hypothetical protein M3Y95_00381400 [Aphelenchoides besseyi]|nr:hypothetical protein M3Y95_00381400 [Aphelenchoides besseyi]
MNRSSSQESFELVNEEQENEWTNLIFDIQEYNNDKPTVSYECKYRVEKEADFQPIDFLFKEFDSRMYKAFVLEHQQSSQEDKRYAVRVYRTSEEEPNIDFKQPVVKESRDHLWSFLLVYFCVLTGFFAFYFTSSEQACNSRTVKLEELRREIAMMQTHKEILLQNSETQKRNDKETTKTLEEELGKLRNQTGHEASNEFARQSETDIKKLAEQMSNVNLYRNYSIRPNPLLHFDVYFGHVVMGRTS